MKSRSVMSSRRRRTLGAGLAALIGVGAALTLGPRPSRPAPSYVALGDSYSSGIGTRTYLNDGTSCQRSVYAYPEPDRRRPRLRASTSAPAPAPRSPTSRNTQLSAR